MPRILIPYLLWWVRLYYRIGHGVAHWVLRVIPMPSALRQRVAGTVATAPYLLWVWTVVGFNDCTWSAIEVGGLITVSLLLVVHRVEVARAGIRH